MKKKQKAEPYIKWVHPKEDFVVPEGYTCIPPAIGHLDDKWAVFRTPRTSDEMGIMISIVEDRIKDELEFLAHGGNVSTETRIGILLGMSLRHLKHMEILGEQKGELKFETRTDRIEEMALTTQNIVMAKGLKQLRIALAKSAGGKKGAKIAEFIKSDQAKKDRANIMTDFNARFKTNRKLYKKNDPGHKTIDMIADETAGRIFKPTKNRS